MLCKPLVSRGQGQAFRLRGARRMWVGALANEWRRLSGPEVGLGGWNRAVGAEWVVLSYRRVLQLR